MATAVQQITMRPGYKQSEVGMIPGEWEAIQFGNLMDFRNGVNADKRAYGKGIRFINVLEIITHTHLRSSEIPGRVMLAKGLIDLFAVHRGDLIFNRTSETQEEVGLSSVYLDDEAVVFGGFVIRGRPKHNPIDATYSGYALRSSAIRSQIIAKGQGAIRANIGQADLRQVWAPLPPLPEQLAIAAALADMDGLIASLDILIAKKRNIKTAAMQQLLTGKRRLPGFGGVWELTRLGKLGSTYGGLTGKTKADFGVGLARYIPFLNVLNNVIIDPADFELVRVSESERQNEAMKGDLFFNGSSETPEEVGMCAVLLNEVKNVFLNSFCFGLRFRDGAEADGRYLAYWFRSRQGRELLYSLAQGATRYNLSKTSLLKLEFAIPGLKEQTAIATVLSDMDSDIAALEVRRDKTHALKQGMMQQLLTGNIRIV